jgi:predicted DNA-binding transcriptional regulator YafY
VKAERLVALLFTLQRRRSATAAELGVSERTMHRDLAALRDAGVPRRDQGDFSGKCLHAASVAPNHDNSCRGSRSLWASCRVPVSPR